MKDIIPKSVFELNTLFKKKGFELFVVGGSVRDFSMGKIPKDFDLSTNAMSDQIIKMIEGKYKYEIHGKGYLVVVVRTEDTPLGFEIATFRSDIYDGKLGITRNPDVVFSDIDGDCDRRDLTFNAMYYDIEKDIIIDKKNGLQDIKDGICRFVGDPLLRIMEDPQRMVRIIRFASRFSFKIDPEVLGLITENIWRLDIITRDRITKEFVAMFVDGTPKTFAYGMRLMHQCGIFEYLFKQFLIDTSVISSKYMEVHFAHMLLGVDDPTLFHHMVETLKFKKTFVRKVLFIKKFKDFDRENVLNIFKKKRADDVDNGMLEDFIHILDSNRPELLAFLDFKPTVKSDALMKRGFLGAELGAEQQRLEVENFCKIIEKYDF